MSNGDYGRRRYHTTQAVRVLTGWDVAFAPHRPLATGRAKEETESGAQFRGWVLGQMQALFQTYVLL